MNCRLFKQCVSLETDKLALPFAAAQLLPLTSCLHCNNLIGFRFALIASESGRFFFADVPDEGPVLRTEVQEKSIGARIKANCTTPGSYPPMNVTWFINDLEVNTPSYCAKPARSRFTGWLSKFSSCVRLHLLQKMGVWISGIICMYVDTPENHKRPKVSFREQPCKYWFDDRHI